MELLMNTATQVPDEPDAVPARPSSPFGRAFGALEAWLAAPGGWPKRILASALTRYATVILLVILVIVFSILTPSTFLTTRTWDSILAVQVVVATMPTPALL